MTRLRLLLLVLTFALAGCGIQPEAQPTAVALPENTGSPSADARQGGPREVTIYLTRDQRLVAVQRDVEDVSVANRVGLLLVGPTSTEAAGGMTSTVPPQSLRPVVVDTTSGVAYVEATSAFTEISGANQLLAVAQVVWTVTEQRGTNRVSIVVNGEALEVPTDEGLSRVPVERDQYLSVAPLPAPSEEG